MSARRRGPLTVTILIFLLIIAASSGCITKHNYNYNHSHNHAEREDEGGGALEYPASRVEYRLRPLESGDNYTLSEVVYTSMGTQIVGLLRVPKLINEPNRSERVPGVVLLPGAGVTKEGEQRLARYLCSLGYASLAIDQRNLGVIDVQRDLKLFRGGEVPEEHKMVHDALLAAAVMREQPEIDGSRIVYMGESNGARFAIIACAIDKRARGVIAISTCGYAIESAAGTGALKDPVRVL